MRKISLNGSWIMKDQKNHTVEGMIPGSVYSFLLNSKEMPDPYYRDNELSALKLMDEDYTFGRNFRTDPAFDACAHQVLRFEGIDTVGEVYLNGQLLGKTDNMHLAWEYDVKDVLRNGENELLVRILSPNKYIAEKDREFHVGGSTDAMRGFPQLRKAHCMFGWDWGPRLPDGGIWKEVSLIGWNESRIEDVRIRQKHFLKDGSPAMGDIRHASEAYDGKLRVEITVDVEQSGNLPVKITLAGPDSAEYELEPGLPFRVPSPRLWWPNGLGKQPLYTVSVSLQNITGAAGYEKGTKETFQATETVTKRIGLRTLTMRREKDTWGETFATEVNGQTFFAMGADYIPEDNVLSRMTKEKTSDLLRVCRESHFNVIRVWGGGFYPFDYFYDLCDELGLLVWQDFMFACANYRLTDAFVSSIREEIRQNVKRLRHHASLGLWCGNNEMEQFALEREFEGTDQTAADYLIQNEFIIPETLREVDPDTFYWPSSPSSGGKFVFPRDPDRGDVHYWEVWHSNQPVTAYRDYHFRYLSEFGFQSFPCLETVKSFTLPQDRNIFSYVMEMHQRNSGANGKIMNYLSATYLYPNEFDTLLYASQLLQAEAIRYGVEHFRRNRTQDRCMGAVYWQLNDIWPVASWASIDYFHRWKALQYFAKRFFAPVMVSCEETSEVSRGRTCISEPAPVENTARLNVTNETWEPVTDVVEWELRDADSSVLQSGLEEVRVAPFSSIWLEKLDFSEYDHRSVHFSYRLRNRESCGSVLFAAPKHYRFVDPKLKLLVDSGAKTVTVQAAAFAKAVEIYAENGYVRLDDNYFDMESGERTLRILEGTCEGLKIRSVFDIR